MLTSFQKFLSIFFKKSTKRFFLNGVIFKIKKKNAFFKSLYPKIQSIVDKLKIFSILNEL